ncbi:Cytochrome c-type biogenesis protein CcmH precursor [Oligella urethralis]|uniref:cytochrome c-type biogenesis protein n=1 Tax=Oligella urethralis TaxID=90245 RepID=UPI000362FE48|nr:cytochrome c-type biogenesis protein [Oligella urethralis]PMC18795.1 cytochrome c-type biogenesis protein CcmH [Oligella urethralis]SUA53917.1 Cytochrome c-type biogenesis protein CcmH precursor [Oligella urethralis]SUA65555.1 Cytochrome c-type biogenesis protein CcmH precursor [Oligella urethralis]SUA94684.1 Cytochrome c-type biogenesis protein CcmH precursor [Oligella urethralis]
MKKLFNHTLLSLLFAAVLSLMTLTAQAQEGMAPITLSPELEQREHQLAKNLRCLVCQNQSIADSGAGLADDLKAEIRLQLSLGKSDEEIVQHMVERYGEFINYKPAFNSTTFLLWVGPALVLGLMLVLLIRTIRQQGKGLNMRDSESAE